MSRAKLAVFYVVAGTLAVGTSFFATWLGARLP